MYIFSKENVQYVNMLLNYLWVNHYAAARPNKGDEGKKD